MDVRSLLHRLDEQMDGRFDIGALSAWLDVQPERAAALDEVALTLARGFVGGSISHDAASGALNRLMAEGGFEAPPTFWAVYIAFEDAEVAEQPEVSARERVMEALASRTA